MNIVFSKKFQPFVWLFWQDFLHRNPNKPWAVDRGVRVMIAHFHAVGVVGNKQQIIFCRELRMR